MKPLNEEELNWIVEFALEQTTVEDVLDVVYICYGFGCIITIPSMKWEGWKSEDRRFREGSDGWPSGILQPIKHLDPIYRHAIRLIETQDDALEIQRCGLLDGISSNESLAAFYIALEFCHSEDNLNQITDELMDNLDENSDGIFSIEEEILAIFEKRRDLLERNREE